MKLEENKKIYNTIKGYLKETVFSTEPETTTLQTNHYKMFMVPIFWSNDFEKKHISKKEIIERMDEAMVNLRILLHNFIEDRKRISRKPDSKFYMTWPPKLHIALYEPISKNNMVALTTIAYMEPYEGSIEDIEVVEKLTLKQQTRIAKTTRKFKNFRKRLLNARKAD